METKKILKEESGVHLGVWDMHEDFYESDMLLKICAWMFECFFYRYVLNLWNVHQWDSKMEMRHVNYTLVEYKKPWENSIRLRSVFFLVFWVCSLSFPCSFPFFASEKSFIFMKSLMNTVKRRELAWVNIVSYSNMNAYVASELTR